LEAKTSEKYSRSFDRGLLRPSEFIQLAGELTEILKSKGVTQIIVFGDEANHVSPNVEMELFRSNFEAFSEKNVQFVFAANPRAIESVPKLKEIFPLNVELRGFADSKDLQELINLYLPNYSDNSNEIIYSENAQQRIWQVSNGHPREIQRICRRSYELAIQRKILKIDTELIFDACLDLYDITSKIN
jgi:hypothetical protein